LGAANAGITRLPSFSAETTMVADVSIDGYQCAAGSPMERVNETMANWPRCIATCGAAMRNWRRRIGYRLNADNVPTLRPPVEAVR
jgi:hypothetical protein